METTLRARLRAGDPEAFRLLFSQHVHAVHQLALRVSGDAGVAEDVVSQTFLQAWRSRGRLQEEPDPDRDSLRPWLLGIATNVLRNTARSARRQRAALARLPPPTAVPDIAQGVADRFGRDAEVAAVRAALGRLRQPEREVIALCVWSGLDYAAAARALGVPVGTVRSRLSRARARLRKLAEEEFVGWPPVVEPPAGGGQLRGGRHQAARFDQEELR